MEHAESMAAADIREKTVKNFFSTFSVNFYRKSAFLCIWVFKGAMLTDAG